MWWLKQTPKTLDTVWRRTHNYADAQGLCLLGTGLFEESLDWEDVGNLKGHITVYSLVEGVQSNYWSPTRAIRDPKGTLVTFLALVYSDWKEWVHHCESRKSQVPSPSGTSHPSVHQRTASHSPCVAVSLCHGVPHLLTGPGACVT